jgi:RNA polymerase sigma-70 factor, ECF subfamily
MHRCDLWDRGRSCGSEFDPEVLLVMVKTGDAGALRCLLERYRNYLGLLVRLQVGRLVRCKLDIESILDEIWRETHRNTALFRGASEREFLSWVRRVMGEVLANQVRRDSGAKTRDLRLERALVDELDRSSCALSESASASRSSPGRQEACRNQAVLLADALQELPNDHREVIILRQLEGLRFPDVACRLGRTEDSVKSVWVQALARLRFTLESLQ